jgi:hypothetical protein
MGIIAFRKKSEIAKGEERNQPSKSKIRIESKQWHSKRWLVCLVKVILALHKKKGMKLDCLLALIPW